MNKKLMIALSCLFVFLLTVNKLFSQTNKVLPTGNVGIGTPTPTGLLHVIGGDILLGTDSVGGLTDAGGRKLRLYQNDDGSPKLILGASHSSSTGGTTFGRIRINAAATGAMLFEIGNGAYNVTNGDPSTYKQVMQVTSAGHVVVIDKLGIAGSVAPLEPLDVNGNVRTSVGSGGTFTAFGTNTTHNNRIILGADSSGAYINSMYSSGGKTAISFRNSNVTAMHITDGGSVGIGTSAPTERLQVQDGDIYINNGTNASILKLGGTNFQWQVKRDYADDAKFKIRYAQGSLDAFVIDRTGKVGIGTTSPAEKLDVNGNAYFNGNIATNGNVTTKKMIVTQLGWSDYVFASDYKLRSLSSVEQFISKNKHLPDVPSAKQVESKGIDVGDTQAILLRKIEELTLYMIAQDKKIAQLEQKMKRIHKANKNK
jgi:hypothetical protein